MAGERRPGVLRGAVAVLGAFIGVSTASVVALADAPDDPGFSMQWALTGSPASTHAPQAWCANTGGGVLVADVDTGADFNHPDLQGKLVAGASFTSGRGDWTRPDATGQAAVQDDQWHGTMTTGIIVAGTNNGVGIAAVAPGARALIVQVLTPDPRDHDKATGDPFDVAAGIDYAVHNGAKVINLSIGTDTSGLLPISGITRNPVLDAIDRAWASDVLVVAASGNAGDKQTDYSSVTRHALVVGALRSDGSTASYSSGGSNVNAPGGEHAQGADPTTQTSVLSTFPGNSYAVGDGTSFAAPMVAGTAAMLRSRGMSAAATRDAIINTEVNGSHLDAAAALGRADNGPACPPPQTGAAPDGAGISVKAPAKAPPARRAPAPAVAAAPPPSLSPSPSPSPSPSASPSPSGPVAETFPSPKVLAHAPPTNPPGQTGPAGLLVLGLAGGIGVGYGALRLLQAVR
jgi:subtilisin family serine protease